MSAHTRRVHADTRLAAKNALLSFGNFKQNRGLPRKESMQICCQTAQAESRQTEMISAALRLQHGQQRRKSASAMAECVLRLQIQFGHGAVQLRADKRADRSRSRRCRAAHPESRPRPRPPRCAAPRRRGPPPTRSGSAPCALRWGTPASRRSSSRLFHTSVLSLASGESTMPGIGGKAGRAHAGRAFQRIHFQAGVVRQHPSRRGQSASSRPP